MAARPHGSQVTECSLVVAIPAGGGAEEGKSFAVQLSNAQGGAQLSKRCRCIVTFSSDDEVTEMTNKLLTQLKDRMNIFKVQAGGGGQPQRRRRHRQRHGLQLGETTPLPSLLAPDRQ
jgi:hypothetical protein